MTLITQLILREHPKYINTGPDREARLTLGRDRKVYLANRDSNSNGIVLCVSLDGAERTAAFPGWMVANVTATVRPDGEIFVASANRHLPGGGENTGNRVIIYDHDFAYAGEVGGKENFEYGDDPKQGYLAPSHIEAAAADVPSGDLYAVDTYRDRILRISAPGKIVTTYSYQRDNPNDPLYDMRVWEQDNSNGLFYQCSSTLSSGATIRCVDFDSPLVTKWSVPFGSGFYDPDNPRGGFDVDNAGTLYVIDSNGTQVKRFSRSGSPITPDIALRMPIDELGASYIITGLRVTGAGDKVLIKRNHPTELFQCYDASTGTLLQVVEMRYEKVIVSFPDGAWAAGMSIPFSITHTASGLPITPRPQWRVWGSTLGALDYQEFPWGSSMLQVPADCTGVYQIKVSPELQPRQCGAVASEYLVQALVEIRLPGTQGTVSVMTPVNRVQYGRGEQIPFSVRLRRGAELDPVSITLHFVETTHPAIILAEGHTSLRSGDSSHFVVPAWLTAALRLGDYRLVAQAPGLTTVSQPLTIGPGLREPEPALHVMQYGDYSPVWTDNPTTWWRPVTMYDVADRVTAHVTRTGKLGMNLMIDRNGTLPLQWDGDNLAVIDPLVAQLSTGISAEGVDPDKARIDPPTLQTMAAYSAQGIQQMTILLGNDSPWPAPDEPLPTALTEAITGVTAALAPFPAFRGWSWAANWWFNQTITPTSPVSWEAAAPLSERLAYEAALQRAHADGTWNPILDTVAEAVFAYATTAQKRFNDALGEMRVHLKTAVSAPYRNLYAYPPGILTQTDEVDLHAQLEQSPLPYYAPHNVDFYKRPGKRAWAHPENFNDDGTGEQILSTLFQLLMRGADGVGVTEKIPMWWGIVPIPEDSRISYQGIVSIYRAMGDLLRQYGPWLASLHSDDSVAIVASGRMFKIDEWTSMMGTHFARVMEAYVSCLFAHHPASIVFTEDLHEDSLTPFKAILIVDQTVELEPGLAIALHKAQTAGATVLYDETCRASLLTQFMPLGLSFNKFEVSESPLYDGPLAGLYDWALAGQFNDDSAFWRFLQHCQENLAILGPVLDGVAPSSTSVKNNETLLSQRKSEGGRYVFIVNTTAIPLGPGQLWRVTINATTHAPVQVPVDLGTHAHVVYDVFAMRQVGLEHGVAQADLRDLPARIFAVLPATIQSIHLEAPTSLVAGQHFFWKVAVHDAGNHPILASIPVRVRLRGAHSGMLDERFVAVGSAGISEAMRAPFNAPPGGLVLEATELFSGKSACLNLDVSVASTPFPLLANPGVTSVGDSAPLGHALPGVAHSCSVTVTPSEQAFGPHIRDIVVTGRGTEAIITTMNWNENVYALDLASGRVRWRQRVGQYFAFAPHAVSGGFAVQGFDFASAEGYHLYLGSSDGKIERRFALYGVPHRLQVRFLPELLQDRINNFAIAPDGSWIASAGDLGLALWSRDGSLRWSQDWWREPPDISQVREITRKEDARQLTPLLAVLDLATLLVVEDRRVTALAVASGAELWHVDVVQPGEVAGEVMQVRVSGDGMTVALLTTTEGGRMYVLRNRAIFSIIPTPGQDFAISADGVWLAVAADNQLKLYSAAEGLKWLLPCDDIVRFPRFSPDGHRIAASSDLGTTYVVGTDGSSLLERDMHALAVPAWLPDGELLLATWMGRVVRLDGELKERWTTLLRSAIDDVRPTFLAPEPTQTTRATWGNADAMPAALTPNLLAGTSAHPPASITSSLDGWGAVDTSALIDGKITPSVPPWVPWSTINWISEPHPFNYIQLDTIRTQVRATGITFAEDPDHPESWLRDAYLEYWDVARKQWVLVQRLLSPHAVVHTHTFPHPVEATSFRIVLPWGVYGNLRLRQIVLHGTELGPSIPT